MQTLRSLAAVLILPALVHSQGLFVPEPRPEIGPPTLVHTGIEATLQQVNIEVRDGAATTTIAQTLRNTTPIAQEAWWMLPLPAGAAADRFTMTVGGVATTGEVLDAGAARSVYEEIVRKRRDPGLLEYLGNGCLRARVFPIPANGELQVAVRYTQMLPSTDGVTTLRFPSRSAWLDGQGPAKLAFVVSVRTTTAIKTAWSPLPELAIARDGDHKLVASAEYARGAWPARDLTLHFGLADQDFGASVLTWRHDGQPGYFVTWLAPKRDWPQRPELARAVNLVLDTSGSMAGDKIAQARAAVRNFVQSLQPRDWFNVIPFSTDARPFFAQPVPATPENRATALRLVDDLQARGGTNIEAALAEALRHPLPETDKQDAAHLVPITVFLTDGLPTVGTTDIDSLLQQCRTGNGGKTRIFTFGVGTDVNTRLLDTLSAETRGDRDYVVPGEDIEQKTSALFAKLSGPVMTDLQISVDGLELTDVEPRLLPDMFVQGQIAVVGRYRGDGKKTLHLRGRVGGEAREYTFETSFPAVAKEHDWLPSLWAQRRIAALLDAIRLHGQNPELVAEVTRLGKEFGIATPFTSHLIVEEGLQVASVVGATPGFAVRDGDTGIRLRREWQRAGLEAPAADAPMPDLPEIQKDEAARAGRALAEHVETGSAAVEQTVALLTMARDGLQRADGAVGLLHQRIGERTFHLVGGTWVDGACTAELLAGVRRIEAFSDAYFELLHQHPDLARVLAFSTRVLFVVDGAAIEITA